MKKTLIYLGLCCLLLLPMFGNAQVWQDAVRQGGANTDNLQDTYVDPSTGDVFVTGSFVGTTTFNTSAGTIVLNANSGADEDIFVIRMNNNRQVLWAVSFGGSNQDIGRGIVFDGAGNVYVTGYYYSPSIVFGAQTVTNAGDRDMFLLGLNASNGVVNWANSTGTSGGDSGNRVVLDGSGNIYLVGFFTGTTTLGATTLTSAGAGDFLAAKFNSTGACLWARRAGGTGEDSGYDLRLVGNTCYMLGFSTGTLTYGGATDAPGTISGFGGFDVFLVSYDASTGAENWLRTAGSTSNDSGFGIEVDASNNPTICGYYNSTANFGGTNITSAGGLDMFLAQYNTSGTLLWVRSGGGTGNDYAYDVDIDACSGKIFVSGSYEDGSPTFGTTTLVNSGGTDVFVASYNSIGGFETVKKAGGAGNETALINVVSNNRYLVSGSFSSATITFDGAASPLSLNANAAWVNDLYFAQSAIYPNLSITASKTTVCPTENPPTTVLTGSVSGFTYTWSPSTGLSATTGNPVTLNVSNMSYGPHTVNVTATSPCVILTGSITISVDCPLPIAIEVGQNYPNPVFGSTTTVPYATNGVVNTFTLKFYRYINSTLVLYHSESVPAGGYSGTPVTKVVNVSSWPSSTYYYRLESSTGVSQYKSMIVY